jgi:hypothetical protein
MTYKPYSRHRDGTPRKSQWTISITDERACFNAATSLGWCVESHGWGLYPATAPQYLGVAQDHTTSVFIAKFVSSSGVWHGYPGDHQRNPQDIPLEHVLNDWLARGLLPPAKLRKLVKGQPCAL